MALKDAGVSPNDIDYVNAHATSTPVGDRMEAEALAEVFGESRPYVTSTKSQTGHECWMAGASELIYSIIMMKNSFIAPNLNYIEGDESSSKLNIPNKRVSKKIDCLLSNSFGFGGTNATLVVKNI